MKKIAQILLEIKTVKLNTKEPFKYVSGTYGPIYCDGRLIMSFPEAREKIIKGILDLCDEIDVVAGTATSGIPFAAWISQKLNLPMIYIRKSIKGYGTDKLIEGVLSKGQKVLLIEDVINTGGSSIKAVESIRAAGGIVDTCIAIYSHERQESALKFAEAKCELKCLTNLTEVLEVAEELKIIDDTKSVLEWKEDPIAWSKRYQNELNKIQ